MLKDNERIDYLIKEGYEIIQNDDVFSFSTDALLLGYYRSEEERSHYGFMFR